MTRLFGRHPEFFALSRYAEEGEDGADLGQIRTHLRDCSRCRDHVAWIRRLQKESGRLRELDVPEGALDRILERRAAGERMILPVDAPIVVPPAWRRQTRWVGAAAVIATLAFIATISLTGRASAGSNELTLDPRHPAPGDEVSVRYTPTIGLAGADSLRLRVRFRAVGQDLDEDEYPGDYLSLTMFPDDAGIFAGRFYLPPTAAYAQLAVEDTPGATVDANNGRLWEILTYDENHKVRFEALRQRAHMAEWEQDWRRGRETSTELNRLFPGQPEGWSLRARYELTYTDPIDQDSVLEQHREVLNQLEKSFARRTVPVPDLASMMTYADQIGADNASTFWESRLARAAPGHYLLQRRRLGRLLSVDQPDWATALDLAEAFWASSDPGDRNVAQIAMTLALRAEEWEQALIWTRRLTDLDPDQAFIAGRILADFPSTRSVSIDYLRRAAELWEQDPEKARPLGDDVLEYGRERTGRLQKILVRLTQALVESGEYAEAVSVTARAADLGWNPELLLQLAEYRLAARDTLGALDLLASAAADPLNGAEAEQMGRNLVGAVELGAPEWLQTVAEQCNLIQRWVLELAEFRHLGPEMTVEAVDGSRVPITALVPSQPTLIAVTPYMMGHFSNSALSRFSDLHERLATRGFPFVVLTTDVARSELRRFLDDERPVFQVFHDPDNVSGEFLGVSRDIEYIVFDADGIVRGVHWDLDDALRLLYLLPQARQVA